MKSSLETVYAPNAQHINQDHLTQLQRQILVAQMNVVGNVRIQTAKAKEVILIGKIMLSQQKMVAVKNVLRTLKDLRIKNLALERPSVDPNSTKMN